MREVKKLELRDGVFYTGQVLDDKDVPNGIGILNSYGHHEKGHFVNGKLDGVAMLETKESNRLGYVKDGKFDGWGLRAKNGIIQFGVLQDEDIVVDLSPLVDVFVDEMLRVTNERDWKIYNISKEGYIFFGIPRRTFTGRMGFHFMEDGNVFLGLCDHESSGKSGYFLHFDTDYNITRGRFDDGILVKEMDAIEFISSCDVFANRPYLSFDISLNYHPNSFSYDKLLPLHIFDIGRTDEFYFVRAGIGTLNGTQFTCERGGYDSTLYFAFPLEDKYKERLLEIYNDPDGIWTPYFDEYYIEFIYNLEQDNNHLPLYKHKSFENGKDEISDLSIALKAKQFNSHPSGNFDNLRMMCEDGNYLRLIPNYGLKRSQLFERWDRGGVFEHPSPRDYVYSLSSCNDNFFEWLFDNPQLRNCPQWNLPYEESEAFDQFLNLFFDV